MNARSARDKFLKFSSSNGSFKVSCSTMESLLKILFSIHNFRLLLLFRSQNDVRPRALLKINYVFCNNYLVALPSGDHILSLYMIVRNYFSPTYGNIKRATDWAKSLAPAVTLQYRLEEEATFKTTMAYDIDVNR